jgi:hypothetical protein
MKNSTPPPWPGLGGAPPPVNPFLVLMRPALLYYGYLYLGICERPLSHGRSMVFHLYMRM